MRLLRSLLQRMGPTPTVLASFIVLFGAGSYLWRVRPPAQPLVYNHKKHIDNGINCTDCHVGAQNQVKATLPDISICMQCHESPLTQSPEEAKIRAAAAAGKGLPWVQITRVPPHVYFSHRRHVEAGKVECTVCHGPMPKATVPIKAKFRPLDMKDCLGCHAQRGVKTDCNDCHR